MSIDWAVFAAVSSFISLKVSLSLFKVSTTIERLDFVSLKHSLGIASSSSVVIVDSLSSQKVVSL